MSPNSPETWTVQTVAFRDYRSALAIIESLETLGLDAYTEFAMYKNLQYTRVRIGCFTSKEAATRFARSLAGRITAEAVPLPMTPGARIHGCVDMDIGFLKPSFWRIAAVDPAAITFEVKVAGQQAFVRHDGRSWRVLQRPEAPEPQPQLIQRDFRQRFANGVAMVGTTVANQQLLVCGGKLLWQANGVAVVEQADAIVACRVQPSPADGGR